MKLTNPREPSPAEEYEAVYCARRLIMLSSLVGIAFHRVLT